MKRDTIRRIVNDLLDRMGADRTMIIIGDPQVFAFIVEHRIDPQVSQTMN